MAVLGIPKSSPLAQKLSDTLGVSIKTLDSDNNNVIELDHLDQYISVLAVDNPRKGLSGIYIIDNGDDELAGKSSRKGKDLFLYIDGGEIKYVSLDQEVFEDFPKPARETYAVVKKAMTTPNFTFTDLKRQFYFAGDEKLTPYRVVEANNRLPVTINGHLGKERFGHWRNILSIEYTFLNGTISFETSTAVYLYTGILRSGPGSLDSGISDSLAS
ncbi:MAG: hypothetical protein A3I05_04220 [Deltaproteobacteria bacterium RIFCSPLOWO2_02_FULL_44_10]|nr:MAG: hypothetical protein A3C46_07035 [Deltaproteobacteria bacterium RIFCSPHIGHO2_02_FULL_44_16]OGQ46572.1 MAG: hypothetical protein A3I05_04220 [Deltaproteobacteria bacterium RIFCSPLOWO2_02_FULL_44_10]